MYKKIVFIFAITAITHLNASDASTKPQLLFEANEHGLVSYVKINTDGTQRMTNKTRTGVFFSALIQKSGQTDFSDEDPEGDFLAAKTEFENDLQKQIAALQAQLNKSKSVFDIAKTEAKSDKA